MMHFGTSHFLDSRDRRIRRYGKLSIKMQIKPNHRLKLKFLGKKTTWKQALVSHPGGLSCVVPALRPSSLPAFLPLPPFFSSSVRFCPSCKQPSASHHCSTVVAEEEEGGRGLFLSPPSLHSLFLPRPGLDSLSSSDEKLLGNKYKLGSVEGAV